MNYTDVDDKTIKRSREQYPNDSPKNALKKLTDHFIKLFLKDMALIGNETHNIDFVRATDYIDKIKEKIQLLVEEDMAYISDDGVYFSIQAYKNSGKIYGQLLNLDSANTSEARINNDEYDKEQVHDFALWKKAKPGEPVWKFDLNGINLDGRPGWHIECSVMSEERLGLPFDIHTGGVDLIFPHHENEIAQSTAGKPLVKMSNFFMHNSHVLVNEKKMSKSLGNFYRLSDIVKENLDAAAFRLMVLQARYRSELDFTLDNLRDAKNRLINMRRSMSWIYHSGVLASRPMHGLTADFARFKNEILEALGDDLNTPKALSLIDGYTNSFNGVPASQLDIPAVEEFAGFVHELLGIDILDTTIDKSIRDLINRREDARKKGDWATADEIRQELTSKKVRVDDTEFGPIWYLER